MLKFRTNKIKFDAFVGLDGTEAMSRMDDQSYVGQMVTNYVWLKDNPSEPLNLVITHSFERGNFDVCLDGCKKMWRSYKQGYTNLNANEIVRLTSLYRACLQKKGLPAVLE